ncbi:DUF4124 domain-containing protein [Geobacter argillaceus]|uniref:Uncharacterized protein DUF4124 n=1 Tax=Geobacter argillaceus TaxID=345631 RepID=A0A562VGM3_9BACT|nr:DUF4124 domain-containing protein [Geobacter argillaceus]TWJ17055.1 uncharacterized protein DUF4124 [Geobacter argillaceus]
MKSRGEVIGGIVLLLLVAASGSVLGQTYEWTDTGGVVHFTDNPDLVPRKYRESVRVRESLRGTVEEQSPKQQPTPGTVAEPPKGELLYGGKPFSWWKARYRELAIERQGAVARLEELKGKDVAVKRKKLILQRASDRLAVKEVQEKIATQEELLKSIYEKIGTLEAEARRADVPPRWREQP